MGRGKGVQTGSSWLVRVDKGHAIWFVKFGGGGSLSMQDQKKGGGESHLRFPNRSLTNHILAYITTINRILLC